MGAPEKAYRPYAAVHENPNGLGDARPTSTQVVKDEGMVGKLTDKVIIITGASAGIGVETARALYETGAHLFLAARDTSKVQRVIDDIVAKAENKNTHKMEVLELHLDSLESVKEAAAKFKRRSDSLDILINNAGVMAIPFARTNEGFEMQFGTNHLAHFLFFQLLKPLLIESAAKSGMTSRVINISSAGHRRCEVDLDDPNFNVREYDRFLAYGQSKIANIWMANELDRRYGSKNVHATSLHPGVVLTEIARQASAEDKARLQLDSEPMRKIMKSPEQGAATTVWAAVSKHFENYGGVYLTDAGEAVPGLGVPDVSVPGFADHAYSEEKEKRLWQLSCELVGVNDD